MFLICKETDYFQRLCLWASEEHGYGVIERCSRYMLKFVGEFAY